MTVSLLRSTAWLSLLTDDLDASVSAWRGTYGIGPWLVYNEGAALARPVPGRIARTVFGGLRFEIVEPAQDDRAGPGDGALHWLELTFVTDSIDDAARAYATRGVACERQVDPLGRELGVLSSHAFGAPMRLVAATNAAAEPRPDRVIPAPSGGEVLDEIVQIGIVCERIEDAVEAMTTVHGIGPWRVHDLAAPSAADGHGSGRLANTALDGRPVDYGMRLALCAHGGLSWELIEPLDDRSDYARFLRDREVPAALHHVLCVTGDYYATAAELTRRGASPRQSGILLGTSFAYFDATPSLGFAVEFSDVSPGFTLSEPDLLLG